MKTITDTLIDEAIDAATEPMARGGSDVA